MSKKKHPAANLSAGAFGVLEAADAVLRDDGTFVMKEVVPRIEGRTQAAIYKSLDSLRSRSLVEKTGRDWEGIHYRITKAGREALAAGQFQRRMAREEAERAPRSTTGDVFS